MNDTTNNLPVSKLVKNQKKTYGPKYFEEHGSKHRITATVRHDDECGNGHNSFSITATIDRFDGKRWQDDRGGCCHGDVAQHFPELAPFRIWHLTSTDGPMHYVTNTLYWLGYSGWCDGKKDSPPNLDYARRCAVWADMPESYRFAGPLKMDGRGAEDCEQAQAVKVALLARLEPLMLAFKADVEKLGLTY